MDQKKRQILLIEHEPYLDLTLAQALTLGLKGAAEVKVCSNGKEAREISKAQDLALVISEYRLPLGTGPELIEDIRNDHPDIPAILISDYDPGVFDQEIRQSINGFMTKPFELVRLFDMVMDLLGKDLVVPLEVSVAGSTAIDQHGAGIAPPEEPVSERRRILIMEDDAGLRRIYNKALTKADLDVFEAPTIQHAREHLETNTFDIFICDIHMGRERGTDLLSEKRAELDAAGTQTIMVSAYGQYRYLTEEMGADFFLEKPISLGTLLQLINRLIDSPHRQSAR